MNAFRRATLLIAVSTLWGAHVAGAQEPRTAALDQARADGAHLRSLGSYASGRRFES